MSVVNKTALAVAVAAISAGAQAELKALDDSAMGEMTGQAGLTIDLETKYSIGEFMYKDAGSVYLTGISFGSNENVEVGGFFDNVRVKLDIAGDGTDTSSGYADNYLETGFSGVRKAAEFQAIAAATNSNPDEAKFILAQSGSVTVTDAQAAGLVSDNATTTGPMTIGAKKTYGDGDLLIHVSAKDAWEKLGGVENLIADGTIADVTFSDFLGNGYTKGKDFNFSIDAIGIASSAFEAGDSIGDAYNTHTGTGVDSDGDSATTVLISDLSINGYLGPVDIHIENNGNGFGLDVNGDGVKDIDTVGNADSKINWNTYVNVTDLDVYLDIAGVLIEDMKINNVRGDVTDLNGDFAFGFAQSEREIYAVRNTAGLDLASLNPALIGNGDPVAVIEAMGRDGIALNTKFKGDMEIGALKFGDTDQSIGSLYWTDIESDTRWTISAH
ncbi:hypothetical protein A3715_01785 [Oleiphilus sp. HI0009]|nr:MULTISPECIES: DUF6160 family protein [unclassified Oleiphilus]KZX77512.1 hypothetical protein A3715_01785 [Oleiphilus sp. HI0009]KZY65537.1 hypothetical protein A3738_08540 [Oleiphilus sp. HI0066]KZY67984.1 hypothetical protein A3739_11330 [Oleiphilus sp. HI0067]